jgi:hypothetical protein
MDRPPPRWTDPSRSSVSPIGVERIGVGNGAHGNVASMTIGFQSRFGKLLETLECLNEPR